MSQYVDSFYFYIMILTLIPAMVLGYTEKKIKYYGLMASVFMTFMIVGENKLQRICLILFYIGQLVLVKMYLYLRKKYESKWLMRIFVLLSISPLFIVKISPYFTTRSIGFIGISYITFRVIQIIVDCFDGLIEEISIVDFTYFILFFPSLSSGPIDRYQKFKKDIDSVISKEDYAKDYLFQGVYRIFVGVAYKFILAEIISIFWMDKIPETKTIINTISYAYAYTLYLFFDFAGYSHMAVGTGYILGVRLPENFNKPFLSKNMKEFWNRWHMSLSFWFRDYIYNRFVFSSIKNKRFKSRYTASYFAYLITMCTMGLWHGFKLFYIIYGLYMAIVLILTDYIQRKSKFYKKYKKNKVFNVCEMILNFQVVAFGLLLFSGYLYAK